MCQKETGLILEPGDKLCSLWDRVISKGMHADSVAMAIIVQLGYSLIRRQEYNNIGERAIT